VDLQDRLPGLNYAVITGVVKKRSGIFLTRKGIPVVHLLVENTIENDYSDTGTSDYEIRVDLWGRAARALDERLKEGTAILAEGMIAHREIEDLAGGVHYQNVLKARRVEILVSEKERKA
jgi:primosomal replication protein N